MFNVFMETKDIRLASLKVLIKQKTEKNRIADFARKYDIDATQIRQWMIGYRGIGEKAARSIEKKVCLPSGWLDIEHAFNQDEISQHDHLSSKKDDLSDNVSIIENVTRVPIVYWGKS